MDREAWWATVHTITRSQTQWKPLSMHTHRTDTQLTLNNVGVGALTHQGVASMFVVPLFPWLCIPIQPIADHAALKYLLLKKIHM